jgi:hypothetical protein
VGYLCEGLQHLAHLARSWLLLNSFTWLLENLRRAEG